MPDSVIQAQHNTLSDKSFLIVGVVRNCEEQLKSSVSILQEALKNSREVHWLLVESDSTDDTVGILESLQQEIENFSFTSQGVLREQIPLRTDRIAHCRNIYLDEIQKSETYQKLDYVVMSDFDGVNTLIDESGIQSCWKRNDWDVVSANQKGPYYDVWALRHPEWCPHSCWKQFHFFEKYAPNLEKNLYSCVHSLMITIPPEGEWIEVESAFGGFAIYRREILRDLRYVGLCDNDQECCEHVIFNEQLREKGYRLFINPAMINAGYTEHSKEIFFYMRLRRRIKRSIRRLVGATIYDGTKNIIRGFIRALLRRKGA